MQEKQETQFQYLGQEDPLGEEMTTYSSILESILSIESILRNPMDRGAWQIAVHGVAKSQTWLNTHKVKNMKKCSEELYTNTFTNLNRMGKLPEEINLPK